MRGMKNAFSPRTIALMKRLPTFLRFCIVGGIGFCVDAGILSVLYWGLHWSPFWARIPSFLCAVYVTWLCNSMFTFGVTSRLRLQNFTFYLMSNLIGTSLNFGVYQACIYWSATLAHMPVAALVPAAIVAMIFNYAAAKKVIFRASARQ